MRTPRQRSRPRPGLPTGVIGLEVAGLLVDEGVTPRVLVRRPRRAWLLRALDIEQVVRGLQNPAAVARASALTEAFATIRDTIEVQATARQAGRRHVFRFA